MKKPVQKTPKKVSEPKKVQSVDNGKKNVMEKFTRPEEAIVKGKVTKRADIMKMAISELESKGYTMKLNAMDMTFKAIENAILKIIYY